MIRSVNTVDIIEIDGKEQRTFHHPQPKLFVNSHWNLTNFVILQFPDENGHTIAVNAKDLEAAIQNARNSNRHG